MSKQNELSDSKIKQMWIDAWLEQGTGVEPDDEELKALKSFLALLIPDCEQRIEEAIDTAIGAYESTCEALIEEAKKQEWERIIKVIDEYCLREIDHAKTMKATLEEREAERRYIYSEETIITTLERVRQALKEEK